MPDFTKQRVVIIAEQRLIVDTVRSALRHKGIARTHLFSTPKDGLSYLHTNPNDLLFIDDALTDVSPLEFVAKLRIDKQIVSRFVPVILISSCGRPKTIMRAIKAGVDEVLVKPLSEKTINDRVERTILFPRECIRVPSGYIGPDRRRSVKEFMNRDDRRSQNKAQTVERWQKA